MSKVSPTFGVSAPEIEKMPTYTKLRARYSKGTLRLRHPLRLPEGTEVRVSVSTLAKAPKPRRPDKRRHQYPTRTLPWRNLRRLSGIVALGGDALADSEAIYDP